MVGSGTLKHKAVSGVIWSAIERFLSQGIQFVITVIMARFLLPSDYGMVGMLAIVLQLSQTLMDSGFSSALIRYKDRTEVDYSTVFFFNVFISFVIYGIVYVAAPYIADFYEIEQLTIVTRVLSLVIILNSLSIIPKTKLIIEVDFKTQSKISLLAGLISGVIGIWSAYVGYGVWALVGQTLMNACLLVLFYLYFCRWKPLCVFSVQSFRALFAFGSKLVIANIINTLYRNLYTIVIGKKFSSTDLGYYTRAEQFAQFPSYNLNAIVSRVAYPILSAVQDDDDLLISTYRKYIRVVSFIIFPLMVGLAVLAKPLILLLLTEKWIGIVVLLQILCFDWMFDHISGINLNLLYVKGRSDLALRLEIIKKTIATLILFASIPFGLIGMCCGRVLYSLIATYLNTYYTKSLINLSLWTQLKDIVPYFLMAVVMGGCVLSMICCLFNEYIQLLLGGVVGVIVYLILIKVFLPSIISELLTLLKIKR